MGLDRRLGDHHLPGDLGVRQPAGDEHEHVVLSPGRPLGRPAGPGGTGGAGLGGRPESRTSRVVTDGASSDPRVHGAHGPDEVLRGRESLSTNARPAAQRPAYLSITWTCVAPRHAHAGGPR